MGANSWATFSYPHLLTEECVEDIETYDGVICNGGDDFNLRRIAFFDAKPTSFRMQKIKIA